MMDEVFARAYADAGIMPVGDYIAMHAKKDEVPPPTADPIGFCTLGVGDGSGNLFVHGDYDSIKAAQGFIFQSEKQSAEIAALKAENQRLRDGLTRIAELMTWNERATAVPQRRPSKADISNMLDEAIVRARTALESEP